MRLALATTGGCRALLGLDSRERLSLREFSRVNHRARSDNQPRDRSRYSEGNLARVQVFCGAVPRTRADIQLVLCLHRPTRPRARHDALLLCRGGGRSARAVTKTLRPPVAILNSLVSIGPSSDSFARERLKLARTRARSSSMPNGLVTESSGPASHAWTLVRSYTGP